jgi:SAM-dependent methyltransferase
MTHDVLGPRRAVPHPGAVDFGDFDRTRPIGRALGGDRGKPLDRYYIEGFLRSHAADIRGTVLEIGESLYTPRFGDPGVLQSEVLDVPDPGHRRAPLLVDLAAGDGVPSDRYDCIILTQTLHMIYDLRGVLATVHRALAPGGIVLATVPGISPIDAEDGPENWFWLMTQSAARRLFAEVFGPDSVTVEVHGNVLAATALLQGLALEEVSRTDLDVVDPLYPVLTTVRAVKAG